MRKAAVIGHPISHSISPKIFSFLAKASKAALKTDGTTDFGYSRIHVFPSELSEFVTLLRNQSEYVGLNVTLPHKETILKLLDDLSPEAKAVGAVNVIHSQHSADLKLQLCGHNTDVFGILRTLEDQGCQMWERDALIFGAGGAARAAAYALGKMGARRVYIKNRTSERAMKMAQDMRKIFPNTDFISDSSALFCKPRKPLSLLIQATSIGMKGASQDPTSFGDLRELIFEQNAAAFDLVYNPEQTLFLTMTQEIGLRSIGGLDMLIHQALATWEIWTGHTSDSFRELKQVLRNYLSHPTSCEKPIFLTGFMGAGKSSVGKLLAQQMGWNFIDTDQMIIQNSGMSISKIFEEKGEVFFRVLECKALDATLEQGNRTVISLGGGALMSPENLKKVQASGLLIYLKASSQTLWERLNADSLSRPLFLTQEREEAKVKMELLFQERKFGYEAAQVQIETDDKNPDKIAAEISRKIRWQVLE